MKTITEQEMQIFLTPNLANEIKTNKQLLLESLCMERLLRMLLMDGSVSLLPSQELITDDF